ncbi:hypothetical protein AHiyo8_47500 [Arthrobacter sp. Hiyo8]|uniref:hypothetical protein n=1 Tax=Arthrobacter sp. Hiyo1 TaxID=1588020 RepID=UPI000683ADEE|nr:hypothetical protein [Arthrobacter sp. Hiyo1]BAS16447.1 hypothetical protein AHiyo8_47500 [Arthrobacter sp. Hiyo8]GAP57249.1 hypothetical protein AHiyo1_00550 [Arthrobacter sp. Hiyo1]
MRVIRNAKPVSIVAGSTLLLEGCAGMWLAATAPAGPENGRIVLLSFFDAVVALIWGVVILSWPFWSKQMVLVRVQPADAIPVILPLSVFLSVFLSLPWIADLSRPYLWMGGLLLASTAVSVLPAEKAALAEIPPLRRGAFLDWLRWQNFGAGSLWVSGFFTATFFLDSRRLDAFTPLIIVLALAQAIVSVWRIIEQRRFSKVGLRLSGLQINWLRVIHVSRGHEAAVKELRTMYPKIGPTQADIVIENLYRAEAHPSGPEPAGSREPH